MANTLKEHESNVICGLGTFTYVVPASKSGGLFYMSASVDEVPASNVTITLSQSGSKSASVSSIAPSSTQSNIKVSNIFGIVAAGDVLTCTISTSQTNVNSKDLQLNTLKTIVVVRQGQ